MIRVSVLYPNGPGKTFDLDYYVNRHVPMVVSLLESRGLVKGEVDKGIGTAQPGAQAPYAAAGHLYFQSVEAFQQAFGPHAAQIMGDVPNYTNIEPVIHIAEIVVG